MQNANRRRVVMNNYAEHLLLESECEKTIRTTKVGQLFMEGDTVLIISIPNNIKTLSERSGRVESVYYSSIIGYTYYVTFKSGFKGFFNTKHLSKTPRSVYLNGKF